MPQHPMPPSPLVLEEYGVQLNFPAPNRTLSMTDDQTWRPSTCLEELSSAVFRCLDEDAQNADNPMLDEVPIGAVHTEMPLSGMQSFYNLFEQARDGNPCGKVVATAREQEAIKLDSSLPSASIETKRAIEAGNRAPWPPLPSESVEAAVRLSLTQLRAAMSEWAAMESQDMHRRLRAVFRNSRGLFAFLLGWGCFTHNWRILDVVFATCFGEPSLAQELYKIVGIPPLNLVFARRPFSPEDQRATIERLVRLYRVNPADTDCFGNDAMLAYLSPRFGYPASHMHRKAQEVAAFGDRYMMGMDGLLTASMLLRARPLGDFAPALRPYYFRRNALGMNALHRAVKVREFNPQPIQATDFSATHGDVVVPNATVLTLLTSTMLLHNSDDDEKDDEKDKATHDEMASSSADADATASSAAFSPAALVAACTARDHLGMTPLMYAARLRRTRALALITRNAPYEAREEMYRAQVTMLGLRGGSGAAYTAHQWALHARCVECLAILVPCGNLGWLPVDGSVCGGREEHSPAMIPGMSWDDVLRKQQLTVNGRPRFETHDGFGRTLYYFITRSTSVVERQVTDPDNGTPMLLHVTAAPHASMTLFLRDAAVVAYEWGWICHYHVFANSDVLVPFRNRYIMLPPLWQLIELATVVTSAATYSWTVFYHALADPPLRSGSTRHHLLPAILVSMASLASVVGWGALATLLLLCSVLMACLNVCCACSRQTSWAALSAVARMSFKTAVKSFPGVMVLKAYAILLVPLLVTLMTVWGHLLFITILSEHAADDGTLQPFSIALHCFGELHERYGCPPAWSSWWAGLSRPGSSSSSSADDAAVQQWRASTSLLLTLPIARLLTWVAADPIARAAAALVTRTVAQVQKTEATTSRHRNKRRARSHASCNATNTATVPAAEPATNTDPGVCAAARAFRCGLWHQLVLQSVMAYILWRFANQHDCVFAPFVFNTVICVGILIARIALHVMCDVQFAPMLYVRIQISALALIGIILVFFVGFTESCGEVDKTALFQFIASDANQPAAGWYFVSINSIVLLFAIVNSAWLPFGFGRNVAASICIMVVISLSVPTTWSRAPATWAAATSVVGSFMPYFWPLTYTIVLQGLVAVALHSEAARRRFFEFMRLRLWRAYGLTDGELGLGGTGTAEPEQLQPHAQQSQQQPPPQQQQQADTRAAGGDEEDSILCVICMEERRTVVALPCRHAITCQRCVELLKAKVGNDGLQCIICRTPIETLVEVYL